MRFGDIYNTSTIGSMRFVEKFLWLPLTIDCQTRWLEKAKIKQICKFRGADYGYRWEDYEWMDNDENL